MYPSKWEKKEVLKIYFKVISVISANNYERKSVSLNVGYIKRDSRKLRRKLDADTDFIDGTGIDSYYFDYDHFFYQNSSGSFLCQKCSGDTSDAAEPGVALVLPVASRPLPGERHPHQILGQLVAELDGGIEPERGAPLAAEERSLASRFGASYQEYCRNVRRWCPRVRPWPA